MKPLVSIIIPVIRPEKAKRCIDALVSMDSYSHGNLFDIVKMEDFQRIGCPNMVKALTAFSTGEMVCFLGDDCIPQKGFLKNALKAMKKLPDGWGLVGLNDNSKHQFAPHWLAHKKLLPLLGGEFFHTGYKHCYCDKELTERCIAMGKYIFAEDAKIIHANPFIDHSIERDEHYNRAYSKEYMNHDRDLYLTRRKEGFQNE